MAPDDRVCATRPFGQMPIQPLWIDHHDLRVYSLWKNLLHKRHDIYFSIAIVSLIDVKGSTEIDKRAIKRRTLFKKGRGEEAMRK
jgi:hypothetical protein